SIAMKAPSRTIASANIPNVCTETQPACSAPTTAYTSDSMPAVTVIAPGTSYPPAASSRGLFGISLIANSSTIRATGPGIRKVRRTAAEEQEAAVPEHVAGHDPLQRREGDVQVGADGRQRHADHGHVQAVEEDHSADHQKGAPEARVPGHAGRCSIGW